MTLAQVLKAIEAVGQPQQITVESTGHVISLTEFLKWLSNYEDLNKAELEVGWVLTVSYENGNELTFKG
jgi:hypothetical protein